MRASVVTLLLIAAAAARIVAQDSIAAQHAVDALNAGPLKAFEPITCWTCHRGQTRPPSLPDSAWQRVRDQHVGEFTSPNAALTMSLYSASLGVECSFCHEPGSFTAPTKPAYAVAVKMAATFDEIPRHFEPPRVPGMQCYMCHQGKRIPERRQE